MRNLILVLIVGMAVMAAAPSLDAKIFDSDIDIQRACENQCSMDAEHCQYYEDFDTVCWPRLERCVSKCGRTPAA